MKTKAELIKIVTDWWVQNKEKAELPTAFHFTDSYKGEGLVRCKDIKGGLSIRMESGPNAIDGIFNVETGVWTDKSEGGGFQMQTASI